MAMVAAVGTVHRTSCVSLACMSPNRRVVRIGPRAQAWTFLPLPEGTTWWEQYCKTQTYDAFRQAMRRGRCRAELGSSCESLPLDWSNRFMWIIPWESQMAFAVHWFRCDHALIRACGLSAQDPRSPTHVSRNGSVGAVMATWLSVSSQSTDSPPWAHLSGAQNAPTRRAALARVRSWGLGTGGRSSAKTPADG